MGFSWAGGIKFEPLGRCGALWNGPVAMWPWYRRDHGTMVTLHDFVFLFPHFGKSKIKSFSFDSHEFWWSIRTFNDSLLYYTNLYNQFGDNQTPFSIFLWGTKRAWARPSIASRHVTKQFRADRLAVSLFGSRFHRCWGYYAVACYGTVIANRGDQDRKWQKDMENLWRFYFCEVVRLLWQIC